MAVTQYDSHDEKNAEHTVRLDKTEGFVVIEGRAYPARELVEALAQSGYSELRSVGDTLVLGRRRISPVFKSRQERAMASLCHGSFAYCCPLSKRCSERDRALEILGLTPQDYERMKGDAHHQFIDASRGMSPYDEQWAQGSSSRPTVNAPAVDRGYGSDDYRRDFDTLESAMQSGRRDSSADTGTAPWMEPPREDRENNRESWRTDRNKDFREIRMPQARRQSEQCEVSSSRTACGQKSSDCIEGLGALFAQGELSPFNDDYHRSEGRSGFCFSCGKTVKQGASRCPYCGAPQ